ncbi:MAG: hypothetical protein ACQGVC_10145 [Myxococcota bacterium]
MTSPEEPQRLSDHLRVYVREPTLWPVLLVAIIIFVTIGAAVLLAAVVQRNAFAAAALALLLGLSVDQAVREWRSGGVGWVTGTIAAFWILSAAAALAAVASGLF